MSSLAILTLLLLGLVSNNHPADAYPTYQTFIPNGAFVPNPCDSGMTWPGVGHQSPAGADARNPFGLDFSANGYNWAAVCPLDSDGDGRTNGDELGDPNCVWQRGQPSPNAPDITHPGICEPLNDVNCESRNSWLTCPEPFNCPAINQPDVMNITLTLPTTTVPTEDTSYFCYGFVFPNDTDYHAIAYTAVVSNPTVDHHYLLYVCKDPPGADYFTEPVRCGMAPVGCLSTIAIWGPGGAGLCLSDEYGFHIGRGGYRYGVLQVHMNNPWLYSGLTDSSGFVFYYTTNMRPNDGAVMFVGQEGLAIPPGQPWVTYEGGCSSSCTAAAFSHPIYITSALLHMHMLGTAGHFELIRNGKTDILVNETRYDYNSPISVNFDPPYVVNPGDEMYTTCHFDTRSTNQTTYFGESTSDEMCYVFFNYYPAVDILPYCNQWKTVNQCLNGALFECNKNEFLALAPTVESQNCTATECPPSCLAVMQQIDATACMEGDMGDWFSIFYGYSNLRPLLELCGLTRD